MSALRRGDYDVGLAAPPCSTFSAARSGPGPQQLRGEFPSETYGVKGLSMESKNKVRVGTLLALRARDIGQVFSEQDKPWVVLTPKRRVGNASVFKLPEILELMTIKGVSVAE
eukprot:5680110-Heterocapsa_arctica.AAC.1